MTTIIKTLAALVLAAALWAVETWLLVDAAGYTLTPQVAVIPVATLALSLLPLWFKESGFGHRIAITLACFFLAAFVFQGVVERSGGVLDTKVAAAQGATEARRLLESELANQRAGLADAKDNMKAESRRGGCKATCKTWEAAAIGIQSRIDALVAELSSQVPPVADPVSKRVADMTGFWSETTIRNWRPVCQPIGFMFAIWFLFGVAFKPKVSAPVSGNKETVSEPEPQVGGGGKGLHLIQGGKVTDREIEALRNALSGNRVLTNNELATLMSVTKGEASKRVEVAKAMGIVSKRRVGRHVAISLQHAH